MRLVFRVLEGKNVNLKIMEREDLQTLQEWGNNPEFMGEYEEVGQETRAELEDLRQSQRCTVVLCA
jgi:hypothetical protein